MQIPNPNEVNPLGQVAAAMNDDVLHIPAERKMTDEEIAKAVAHHNRHHKKDTQPASQKIQTGKHR
jgi:hypothetical protein